MQIKAAASVKRLDDGLYTLTYDGDYGFDDFLQQGGAGTDAQMADYIIGFLTHGLWRSSGMDEAERGFGCSTMARSPEGGALFGRNYDWQDCDVMIVKTKPTQPLFHKRIEQQLKIGLKKRIKRDRPPRCFSMFHFLLKYCSIKACKAFQVEYITIFAFTTANVRIPPGNIKLRTNLRKTP